MARWRITHDEPREDLGPDGRFVSSREITFEVLDNGRKGSIMVPLRNYTPEFVSAEISRYADAIHGIGELTVD